MDITKYFTEDNTTYADKNIVIYNFDDALVANFITDCLIPFRQAYIDDDELDENVKQMGTSRVEEIISVLPEKANLKSGDFGEILSYHLLSHIHDATNLRPLKWRWKEHNNSPCHLTDVVLLSCLDSDNPQPTDFLVSVESKSRATTPKYMESRSSVNDAIKDAAKDKVGRFSKTIAYLMAKYKKEKNYDAAKIAMRFSDSIATPYNRIVNAVAIVEREYFDMHMNHIDLTQRNEYPDIDVYVIPIRDLKSTYNTIFNDIPNS